MSRLGITEEDVINTINTLQKNKVSITIENIRNELKTGSNTTISSHLKKWRKNNGISSKSIDPYRNNNQELLISSLIKKNYPNEYKKTILIFKKITKDIVGDFNHYEIKKILQQFCSIVIEDLIKG